MAALYDCATSGVVYFDMIRKTEPNHPTTLDPERVSYPSPRTVHRVAAGLVLLIAFSAVLVSCSSDKTGVGGDLLSGIEGQFSQRDTLDLAFNSAALDIHDYTISVSNQSSYVLLVGEANGYRATSLTRFDSLSSWYEFQYVTSPTTGDLVQDTLHITPTELVLDSGATIQLSFSRYVADSELVYLDAWVGESEWEMDNSVTAALPARKYSENLFSAESLNTEYSTSYIITEIEIDDPAKVAQLSHIVSDSLTLAISTPSGTPMVEFPSENYSSVYDTHLILTFNASIDARVGSDRDTIITATYSASQDCYRLERTEPMPSSETGTYRLAGGAPIRVYAKINRFDLPGISDENGRVPEEITANSALLEVKLGEGGITFQRDDASLRCFGFTEAFDSDSAALNALSVHGDRYTYFGFDETEDSDLSTDSVRVFEIADLINDWWQDSTNNNGMMFKLGVETDNVDAVEIEDLRLILITSQPPVLQRPAAQIPHTDDQEGGAQ